MSKVGCRFAINGLSWPQPEAHPWQRLPAGRRLSTNTPFYSAYRTHRWRYTALPNDPYMARLENMEGTELTSLITVTPDDVNEWAEYTEAKVTQVMATPSWAAPRAVEIIFEVFCP